MSENSGRVIRNEQSRYSSDICHMTKRNIEKTQHKTNKNMSNTVPTKNWW